MGKKEAERRLSEKDSILLTVNMDGGHQTSNAGSLKKLEKAKKHKFSPRSSRKECSPAKTLIVAPVRPLLDV